MKRVLVASPTGPRLYELSDEEFERFDYLLGLREPADRGAWALRFLQERVPARVFQPGVRGTREIEELEVDRAVGGNFFTPKWGRIEEGRAEAPEDEDDVV
jgi:hypothetical protein